MKKLLILMTIILILVGCGKQEEKSSGPVELKDYNVITIHLMRNYDCSSCSRYVIHAEGITIETFTSRVVVKIDENEEKDVESILRIRINHRQRDDYYLIFPSLAIARKMLKGT